MNVCKVVDSKMEGTIVYSSFPQISDLRCAICEIDFIEVRNSAKSKFHWQTLKCRLLIYLIPDIIAAPIMGAEKYIHVIAHKKVLETGKLEEILRNFKLVYQGSRLVTPALYASCLTYTIQSKIAPLWNKVGNYFVQGKEFYNGIGGNKAVTLNIIINEKNMYLQLQPVILRILHIKLEDHLPSSVVSEFLADPNGYIDLSRYYFPFVYVLPSMKKGKVLSVSKKIPSRSIFKNYDQLRRHWKNMYGYSLPRSDDSILYYEIKFLINRSNIFTYPSLCITNDALDIMPSKDKEFIVPYFLSDMLVKLPTICGKPLQISKENSFSTKDSNTSLSNTVSQNEELSTQLKEIGNYNKYTYDRTQGINASLNPFEAQLAKIHKIHNIPMCGNLNIDLNDNRKRQYQSELAAAQNSESTCNIVKNSNDTCTAIQDETNSTYFKIRKLHSTDRKPEEGEQNRLTLKEKLLKAKSNENCAVTLQEMDHHIDVEQMAKSNQLDQVKNSVLSGWLKEHLIPHNPKGRKTELINKILCHVKNTQILQQFRL